MQRLKSIDDFKALRERLIADYDPGIPTIVISAGTCGQASGANELIRLTKRELLAEELIDNIRLRDDLPFYKKQVRTILTRNEHVDPIRIYDYIQSGGYAALVKALQNHQ